MVHMLVISDQHQIFLSPTNVINIDQAFNFDEDSLNIYFSANFQTKISEVIQFVANAAMLIIVSTHMDLKVVTQGSADRPRN